MTFLDWFISFTHIDPVTCTPLKAFEDFTLKWLAHYKWNRKYHPRYSSAVYHRCKEWTRHIKKRQYCISCCQIGRLYHGECIVMKSGFSHLRVERVLARWKPSVFRLFMMCSSWSVMRTVTKVLKGGLFGPPNEPPWSVGISWKLLLGLNSGWFNLRR